MITGDNSDTDDLDRRISERYCTPEKRLLFHDTIERPLTFWECIVLLLFFTMIALAATVVIIALAHSTR